LCWHAVYEVTPLGGSITLYTTFAPCPVFFFRLWQFNLLLLRLISSLLSTVYVLVSLLFLWFIYPSSKIMAKVDHVLLVLISQQIRCRQAITGTREDTKEVSSERRQFCRAFSWENSSSKEEKSFIWRAITPSKINLAGLCINLSVQFYLIIRCCR